MALFDLNKVAKKVQKSAEGLKKTVSDTAGKVSEIKTADIGNAVKSAAQAGQAALNTAVAKGKDVAAKLDQASEKKEEKGNAAASGGEKILAAADAIKIIYYLMLADGEVSPEEDEKFELIGKELDPNFREYQEALMSGSKESLQGALDKQEYADLIHEQVSDVIRNSDTGSGTGIRGKLLLWDLYAVAYSDTSFSDEEKRFIRFVCRALNIDPVVGQEMEQSLLAITAIEEEERYLRTTNRQYGKVEGRMNELADRKQAVMQGIQMLIID